MGDSGRRPIGKCWVKALKMSMRWARASMPFSLFSSHESEMTETEQQQQTEKKATNGT